MKALTARQIIKLEYGNSKNLITDNIIRYGKIDRDTAYELSSGRGLELKGLTSMRQGPNIIYGVSVVRYFDHDGSTVRLYAPWSGVFDSLWEAEHHIKKLKGTDPLYEWTGDRPGIEITLFLSDAKLGSHQGQCDQDIARLRQQDYIKVQIACWNPDNLRAELKEYGAWDDDELADHEDNCDRMLWIMCGNILEELHSNG